MALPILPFALPIALLTPSSAQAQTAANPPCQGPAPTEVLLLVVLQDAASQTKLSQSLPPSVKAPTCSYLGSRVARMGGFRKVEDADAWAKYLRDTAGLAAFIARPAANPLSPPIVTAPNIPPATAANANPVNPNPTNPNPTTPAASTVTAASFPTPKPGAPGTTPALPAPVNPNQPAIPNQPASNPIANNPIANSSGFNPQVLDAAYAVLVDYGQQPSVATQVQTILQQPVGLAAYQQRPYLLAQSTNDSAVAALILRTLSDRGYRAVMVDGRSLVILTRQVRP